MLPVIGIPTCLQEINGLKRHSAPDRYCEALTSVSKVLPVLVPAIGPDAVQILDRLDGLLIPGSPSNIWPGLYGDQGSLTPDRHDNARDSTTIPLICEAVKRGIPILAICRGLQELNVALGGSLYQQLHLIEGKIDHRAGEGTLEEKFSPKHEVCLENDLFSMFGKKDVRVNSLHEQGIARIAEELSVQAVAEDGTVEALKAKDINKFVLGVQFHPEWNCTQNKFSRTIFGEFLGACHSYAKQH